MDIVGLKKPDHRFCDLPLEIVHNDNRQLVITQLQSLTYLLHTMQNDMMDMLQHGLLC